jgi:pimeloyl-ACP methyl ester carboxylesterase
MQRRLLFILFATIAVPAAVSAIGADRFPMLKPCPSIQGALCGALEVPENRATKEGRMIALNVAVVPATAATPAADPLLAITGGGPGVASVIDAERWPRTYPKIHETRDMIFVDQRGTGGSNPLDCELGADAVAAFLGGAMPQAKLRDCLAVLEKGSDLRVYTSAAAADDLDDVRKWLGFETVNVWGSSYASRLALVYAQRHTAHVRTLTLKAPVPPANRNPLNVARDAQAAIDRVFTDCAAEAACAAAYPKLRAELTQTLARLAAEPATVGTFTLTRDVYAGAIRRMLYAADSQRALPRVIAAAGRGDYSALQPILGAAGLIDKVLNLGLFLNITCSEDVAHFGEKEIAAATAGTFTGDVLARSLKEACRIWPRTPLGHDFDRTVRGVPALIISGTLDPDAPPRWGKAMAERIKGATAVEVEGLAHNGTPPCVAEMIQTFMTEKKVENGCGEMRREAFVVK